jgi:hypothetical protein
MAAEFSTPFSQRTESCRSSECLDESTQLAATKAAHILVVVSLTLIARDLIIALRVGDMTL